MIRLPARHSVPARRRSVPQAEQPRKVVLIVEEDGFLRLLLADLLVAEGYAVIEVPSCHQVPDLAEQAHPDVIVLDVVVSERDGLKALSALRSGEATRDIPVIVAAGAARPPERVSQLADAVVRKPYDVRQLFALVGSTAKMSRATSAYHRGAAA